METLFTCAVLMSASGLCTTTTLNTQITPPPIVIAHTTQAAPFLSAPQFERGIIVVPTIKGAGK